MTLYEIVLDYIHKRKMLVVSYAITCSAAYVVKVLVTSFVYSGLFKKDADIQKVFKQICTVWVLLCTLYIVRSRLETAIVPDFLSFLRLKLFSA